MPTRFHLIFSHTWLDEQKMDYEYQLCVNREKVLSESLHYYPDGKAQCAYIRQDQEVTFGNQVPSVSTLGLRKNSIRGSSFAERNLNLEYYFLRGSI
ncbi:MAG: hypothetical protein KAI83_12500 [Thiomargarita sp.]|nr:hypothetical protein [Thiomargarita sp.]